MFFFIWLRENVSIICRFQFLFIFFASVLFLSAQNVTFVDVAGEMPFMRDDGVMFFLKIVSVSLIKFIRSWYGWGGREMKMGVAVMYNAAYIDIFPWNINFKIIQIQVETREIRMEFRKIVFIE